MLSGKDIEEVVADAKPVKVATEKIASKRAFLAARVDLTPAIQLSEWLADNHNADAGLLGAFAYTMRQRGHNAATPSEFDTAFAAFAAEMPE